MRYGWRLSVALAPTLMAMAIGSVSLAQEPQEGRDFAVFHEKDAVSFSKMADELARADVVVVGENHDHKLGHQLELSILKALHQRNPRIALSLEFFERDVQTVLDEYLQGHITESHFKQSSRPWPTYAADYAPLVEYCRANHLDVVAANAPRRYVNIVSRKGRAALQELPRESRSNLPKLPYDMEIPAGYDRMLSELFGGEQHASRPTAPTSTAPTMPGIDPGRMKEAQGLWDATMADSILQYRRKHRGVRVLQMNGAGHSDHGWGIVDRLRRADPRLKVLLVSIKPDSAFPDLPAGTYDGVADYLLLTPEEKTDRK